jgi:hypothetical protein
VVDGDLYVFDVSEGGEERLEHHLCDSFGEIANVNSPLVVVFVNHSLLNIIIYNHRSQSPKDKSINGEIKECESN